MKRYLVLSLFLSLAAGGAFAEGRTASTTMALLATMAPTVSISATNLDFGSWSTSDTVNHNSQASIAVTATADTAFKVALDAEANLGKATTGQRALANGNNFVSYNLFADAAMTIQWGDSDFANTYPGGASQAGTGIGTGQTYTVYGQLIPGSALKTALPGTYTDIVTVTVDF